MKATDQSRLRVCAKASKDAQLPVDPGELSRKEKIVQWANSRKFEIAAGLIAIGMAGAGIAWSAGDNLAALCLVLFSCLVSFFGVLGFFDRMWDLEE